MVITIPKKPSQKRTPLSDPPASRLMKDQGLRMKGAINNKNPYERGFSYPVVRVYPGY